VTKCTGRLEDCKATSLQEWLSGDCASCRATSPYAGRMMSDVDRDEHIAAYRQLRESREVST
jgi:hypothetical protein